MHINSIKSASFNSVQTSKSEMKKQTPAEAESVENGALDASAIYGRACVNFGKIAPELDGIDGQDGKDDECLGRPIDYDAELPPEIEEIMLKLQSKPRKPLPESDGNQYRLDCRDGQIGKDDEEFARFIEYLDRNIPHSKSVPAQVIDNPDYSGIDAHDGSYGKD